MAGPGITHDGFYVPGLVMDIQWSNWERQTQYTTQFGLEGATVLDGGRTKRQFTCPMKIFGGYISEAALEAFVIQIEGQEGVVGAFLRADLSGNLKAQFDNVEFVAFERGIHRFDPDILWWVQANVVFGQLDPP